MDTLILAIDLGKFHSMFCWYDTRTQEHTFLKVPSVPSAFQRELEARKPDQVVIEAGAICGWVFDLCTEWKIPCDVANTNAAPWQWKNVKRKTDKDDALKLAKLSQMEDFSKVTIPEPVMRQWKSLIRLRKNMVGERVRTQNRIRTTLGGQGLPVPTGRLAWTKQGLKYLAESAKPLAECDALNLWRGELDLLLRAYHEHEARIEEIETKLSAIGGANENVQRLQTMNGLGIRTAEIVVTHLLNAERFTTADQVGAYAGLVPTQYQSGETDRRGRVTKRGSRLLRGALVEAAWCLVRYNDYAYSVWKAMIDKGLSRKKAIVALGRKLLIWCWAILRTKQNYRMPELSESAKKAVAERNVRRQAKADAAKEARAKLKADTPATTPAKPKATKPRATKTKPKPEAVAMG
jgi:transposase